MRRDGGRRAPRGARGTPQGGTISPLLANIYLHYVLDLWADQWRKRHARGEMYVVRYADDLVMGFQDEQDARAMREALAERLRKFGLELHPEKTRVIRFGRFAHEHCAKMGRRQPETFDFLGFTHIVRGGRTDVSVSIRRTSRKKRSRSCALCVHRCALDGMTPCQNSTSGWSLRCVGIPTTTACRAIRRRCVRSGTRSADSGTTCSSAGASANRWTN